MSKNKNEAKTPDSASIEVENVGPVSHLRLTIPPEGGLVVLRGRNGSGKSTTLEAITTAATGKGNLSVRDGELRGEVRAFGATVTVAKSTRRRGDVEVVTLEGPGDVSTLVDPGLKSDDAADSRRIRALLALTGAKVEPSIFWPLLTDRATFESIVSPKSIQGDDPVEMAERIKRDIETRAREIEAQRDHAQARASALLSQNEGVNLDVPHDATVLAEEYAAARAEIVNQERASEAYAEAVKRRDAAASKLHEMPKAERDISDLADAFVNAQQHRQRLVDELLDLERQMEAVKLAIADADKAEAMAKHQHDMAQLSDSRRRDLQAIVERALPEETNAVDVEVARLKANKAQKAMELGVLVRQAFERQRMAKAELENAGEFEKRAELLRASARGTDEILSGLVGKATPRLRVEAGRLILDTSRGKTYFADLSHGEKWKIALDVAIEAVGSGGVLVCPQEAYEGLDPINRQLIADHLAGTGVVMFTAEATDDPEVTASVLVGNDASTGLERAQSQLDSRERIA